MAISILKASRVFPLLVAGLLLAIPAPEATAAPPTPPGRPSPTGDGPPDAEREAADRERALRLIEARLERIRAEEASLKATLAAIEAGQPLHELRIPGPPERGPGAGPDDDRGRRDNDRDHAERTDDEFTDEQIQEFIAAVYPEWMDRIKELTKRDPEAMQKLLRDRRPRLIELMIEQRDHPAVFEARQKFAQSEMMIRRVAWSFARADTEGERQEAETKLESLLGEQFDLRIGMLVAELAEVERDAAEKREEIAKARGNRESMIAERKADLLRAIRERRPDPRRDDSPGRRDKPGRDGPDRPDRPDGPSPR